MPVGRTKWHWLATEEVKRRSHLFVSRRFPYVSNENFRYRSLYKLYDWNSQLTNKISLAHVKFLYVVDSIEVHDFDNWVLSLLLNYSKVSLFTSGFMLRPSFDRRIAKTIIIQMAVSSISCIIDHFAIFGGVICSESKQWKWTSKSGEKSVYKKAHVYTMFLLL